MSSLRFPLVLLATGAALLGCSKEAPSSGPKPVGPKPPSAAAAPAAPVAAVGAPTLQQPQPPAFVYDSTGLRDPFEPFIKLEELKKKGAPGPKLVVPHTPLQQYSTEQLKLVGVVWGPEGAARALIEDPQGKGYAVGVGTLLGDRGGKVVRIQPDRVVIEERFTDLFGEEKKNVSNIMLRKSEGEVAR